MHYCCLLITDEFPTKELIAARLAPFSEEDLYNDGGELARPRPAFTWDWYQIGGRYNGKIKLRYDLSDERYEWKYMRRPGRNGRLFWSYLLNKMAEFAKGSFMFSEEDYFQSMGMWDGFLRVDGALVSDILNYDELTAYCCVDKYGCAISRETWNGDEWAADVDFDQKFALAKASSGGCYATIIDLHD